MKVLLVVPAPEHLRVKDNSVPKRKMLRFSVLSLTVVAALTPDEHQVTLCDENVEPLDFDAPCDVVGVSFMTAMAPRAYKIADEFRRRGKVVVAGGFHPTFRPEEAAEHFNSVVIGEAEGLWPKVLDDIQRGEPAKFYRADRPPDLATTPIPRRGLTAANGRHYVTTHAVQTGRGCRHGCKFCSIAAFTHQTYRSRPLESVLEELKTIPRNFMFVDDNIIADPDYAKRLFRAMIPMRKRWISQCSLRIADDPELLALARAAGCRGLFIGIETISQHNLDSVDKGFNDESGYFQRIAAIRAAGIGIEAGIIVGLDDDDPTVFQRMLRFLQKARIDAMLLSILTPQPGTALFDEFERAGRVIDRDWSHYDFRHTVMRPARMTLGQLQNGADWLYSQFYRLDRIILRTARAALTIGIVPAYLIWRVNMTFRYDNRREGIVGANPAKVRVSVQLEECAQPAPTAGGGR
jgi:radical SAM superfamily enzyme YgiQ (UPF0313 family)